MTIKIAHKGQDYTGVEVNGEYYEVSIAEGETIKDLLKIIKRIVNA